jgi:20S proteasome alpha/beta subunit
LELGQHLSGDQESGDIQMDFLHGTTTLAFKYQGGVIVAVDSRATGSKHRYNFKSFPLGSIVGTLTTYLCEISSVEKIE